MRIGASLLLIAIGAIVKVGLVFVYLLAVTVTEVAQVVGTLLVLSLAITPAATARRCSANPIVVTALSILFALIAADGGILLSLEFINTNIKASVYITFISFALYVLARTANLFGRVPRRSRTSTGHPCPIQPTTRNPDRRGLTR
jgi:zinc/manganese transport system permease protein